MNFSQQAKEGVDIWLNNQPNEAEIFLLNLQNETGSLQIKAGYALILCMVSYCYLAIYKKNSLIID